MFQKILVAHDGSTGAQKAMGGGQLKTGSACRSERIAKYNSVVEFAQAIDGCTGVEAVNITVGEIDMETVDMEITIEGEALDYDEIVRAIRSSGAVVHSIDQVVVGKRTVQCIERIR